MPHQSPYTAEMTGVCFIVPATYPVCDPASRKTRKCCDTAAGETPNLRAKAFTHNDRSFSSSSIRTRVPAESTLKIRACLSASFTSCPLIK